VGLGQVHEKARQASIIMSTTQVAQVRNCIVCCNFRLSYSYKYYPMRAKLQTTLVTLQLYNKMFIVPLPNKKLTRR